MHIFTLTKDALILGEKDEKYGYTLWASTDKGDVMFNNQTGSVVQGTQITAEEATPKESKKGKPYQRLSKVKVVEGADQPNLSAVPRDTAQAYPTSSPNKDQLDRIEQKLEEVLSYLLPAHDDVGKDPFTTPGIYNNESDPNEIPV